jgi:hypothetical protein
VNDSYGYNKLDNQLQNARILHPPDCKITAKGGNTLLNIGLPAPILAAAAV